LLVFIAPLLIIVGVVFKLVGGIPISDESYWEVFAFLGEWPSWLNFALSSLIALLLAFVFNQLVQTLGLLGRITNLTMMVFALFYFAIPDAVNHWLAWSVFLMQLGILRMAEEVYDAPSRASYISFSMGILIGLNALIIEGSSLLLILLLQSLVLSGTASFRRVVIGLLGFLTPLYFFNALAYLFRWEYRFPSHGFHFDLLQGAMGKLEILGIVFMAFMAIVAIISVFSVASSSTLRERRRWILVIGHLVIGGILVLGQGFTEAVYVAIVPATIVLTRVLLTVKQRKLSNAILLLFLAIVLLINS